MTVLIVGCRRVGSNLARLLDEAGHGVSLLAETPDDLARMSAFADYSFGGTGAVGIPIDIDNLRTAGIEDADAVACVTPDDNTNLMVAQIAQTLFKKERVICRVTDPAIKEVYAERFGLQVVCPTNLTVETAADILLENNQPDEMTFGCSTVGFLSTPLLPDKVGQPVSALDAPAGRMLFGVMRGPTLLLAHTPALLLEAGDQLLWAEILD